MVHLFSDDAYLQYIFAFVVQRQEVVAGVGRALGLILQAPGFRVPDKFYLIKFGHSVSTYQRTCLVTFHPDSYSQSHVHLCKVDVGMTFQEAAASQDILGDGAHNEARQTSEKKNVVPSGQTHTTCRRSRRPSASASSSIGLFPTCVRVPRCIRRQALDSARPRIQS